MSVIGEETTILTVANPARIGPLADSINLREGTFQTLNVGGTLTITNIVATNATIATLTITSFTVITLGANSIVPSPPGSGVTVDGVVIRDSPHYAVPNRSVASFEGGNPLSSAGISVALVPYGTGAIIGAIPDGTVVGGNTRGNYSVDLQLARAASSAVAAGNYAFIGGGGSNTVAPGSDFASVIGGIQNVITSTGVLSSSYSIICGGINNSISAVTVNSENSIILGGTNNTIENSSHSMIGGFSNTIQECDYSSIYGYACSMGPNSPHSTINGRASYVGSNCPYAVAEGFNAGSYGPYTHTYCATDMGGLYTTNINPRSHKFIDNIFETYVVEREIHNNNTLVWYAAARTQGPQFNYVLKYIPIPTLRCTTIRFHITLSGSIGGRCAHGSGYIRAHTKESFPDVPPFGEVTGSGVFNYAAHEDGGLGFSWGVGYSGSFVLLLVSANAIPAGRRGVWAAEITEVSVSKLNVL